MVNLCILCILYFLWYDVNITADDFFTFKNGCKVEMKKSSDSRGDIHKQMILNFIKAKSSNWVGVEVKEIINHTRLMDIKEHKGLTRQTVTTHLKTLVDEDEIKKTRKGTYLPKEIFDDIVYDGWSLLEDYLNTIHQSLIANRDVLNLRELANIITDLSRDGSNKTKEPLQNFIFKIANRIGAYVVYVFIESLRSRRNVKSEDVRSVLTEEFLKKAIPLMDLLEEFLSELPIETKERDYFEVNERALKKISKAYKKVYPNIAEPIEKNYLKFCDSILTTRANSKRNNCSHKWEKIYVHKVGDRYLCRKCDTIVASPKDIGIDGTASA